jgi:hypothetical protein
VKSEYHQHKGGTEFQVNKEFLMECRKQLISKHDIMVTAVGEKKFHEQWGELYECML